LASHGYGNCPDNNWNRCIFYVSRLAIVEQTSLVSNKYFLIAQVKMLFDFARALGVVFSLIGIAVIILALDRLSLTKAAYRMASLVGFGTFQVMEREARRGVNPQTRKTIQIPAKKVPKFRPGKGLREAVR